MLTVIYLMVISPFVKLWLGKKFVVESSVMILICINFYLMGTQVSLDTIKQACGFYNKDKYVPLGQAIVNLVLSIILGKKMGLFGILIATTISYLVLPIWNKPYLLYKYIFKSSSVKYFFRQLKNIVSLVLIYGLSSFLVQYIHLSSEILTLFVDCFIVLFVFVIIISVLYFKSNEYQYFVNLIKTMILKKNLIEHEE